MIAIKDIGRLGVTKEELRKYLGTLTTIPEAISATECSPGYPGVEGFSKTKVLSIIKNWPNVDNVQVPKKLIADVIRHTATWAQWKETNECSKLRRVADTSIWDQGGGWGPGEWTSMEEEVTVDMCEKMCETDPNCVAYIGHGKHCSHLGMDTTGHQVTQWKKVMKVNEEISQ